MERKPINPLMMAATIVWTLVTFAAFANGEVSFYVQRSGSPDDTAYAEFTNMLGPYNVADFEDETLAPLHGELSELWYDDLGVTIQGDWGGPYTPTIVYSSEFDVEGEIFQRALLAGFGLTIEPAEGTRLNAFGLWLFDDGKTVDSAYVMRVVEENGAEWEVELENEIPLNPHQHEIEGFIGVYSDIGLASVTVWPIDPVSGEIVTDVFETDNWILAIDVMPPPAEPGDDGAFGDDEDDEANGDIDDDDVGDDADDDDGDDEADDDDDGSPPWRYGWYKPGNNRPSDWGNGHHRKRHNNDPISKKAVNRNRNQNDSHNCAKNKNNCRRNSCGNSRNAKKSCGHAGNCRSNCRNNSKSRQHNRWSN